MVDVKEVRQTVDNLLPGQRYSVKVRALNEFGQYSDWSEAMEFTAERQVPTVLPTPPAPIVIPMRDALAVYTPYLDDYDIDEYHIQYSTDNKVWVDWITTHDPFAIFSPAVYSLPVYTIKYFRYKVTDFIGAVSPYSPSNSGTAFGLQPMTYDIPFVYPGPLEESTSPPYKFREPTVLQNVRITLNVAGTNKTRVIITKNNVQIGNEMSLSAGVHTVTQSLAAVATNLKSFNADSDVLRAVITKAGSGAYDIDIQIRATA